MRKYYTRACNFYYGANAKKLIKKKQALPLCGNNNLAFDKIEILSRYKNKKLINIRNIKKLPASIKKIILTDLKKTPKDLFFDSLYSFLVVLIYL